MKKQTAGGSPKLKLDRTQVRELKTADLDKVQGGALFCTHVFCPTNG